MYIVIAHYRASSTTADEVADLLPKLAEASRLEQGNLSYSVTRDLEDSNVFVIVEKYRSEGDFASHRASSHFQEIGLSSIVPLLEDRSVEALTVTPS
ncbi:MAG: putative quinol monooxygenase [Brevibacterium sp.]